MPLSKKPASVITGQAVWAAVLALSVIVSANQAPIVDAGEDQPGVRINRTSIDLFGNATDDLTPVDNLAYLWTQISGPAPATIAFPTSVLSGVSFSQTGTYVFELQVSDGVLIGRDSTTITVLDTLPFVILTPRENAQVLIGHPYLISWQLDPSRMCEVLYSLNDGLSYERISVGSARRDTMTWTFDAGYKDSARQGIMLVHEYQNSPFFTTSTFVLVDSLSGVKPGVGRFPRSSDSRVYLDKGGVVRIAGASGDPSASITIFSASGAAVFSAPLRDGVFSLPLSLRGVLVYRIGTKTGRIVRRFVQ